ncbi:unnamed protein product [Triticum turgidum subsp. durum]|uniref:Uncharacterized protein n=1 Tax=Triticum turgidum subsp. durum TaxID=4567 RepID=A0A9R0SS92_TRITD|nr:unnamed protein product [Triticum turgidum subsp. durum]
MALSVARSLVGSAVNKAASEAMDEMALLMGVRNELWYIKDELRIMQAFLRTAERMKGRDELVKVWAEQVEDLSYDIKHCLDEFQVNLGHPGCLQRLTKLRDRHEIAVQIRSLKVRVGEVSNRMQRYSHLMKPITSDSMDEGKLYKEETNSDMEGIHSYSHSLDEVELVGFSKPKQELIMLMDVNAKHGPANVICVVGMCGVGKTTLATKIYESDVANKFSSCAWITISQPFCRIEFLKDMFKKLLGDEALMKQLEGKVMREEDLAYYLRIELLEKRYFVVLDDLRNIDDWICIKYIVFPLGNNKGSRIIVTTQNVDLAEKCNLESSRSLIYHHQSLETIDPIRLLLRKMRRSEEDMKNDKNMREIVTKIVKKSGRLPLVVLTLGGMLSSRVVTEWQSIYYQLPLELESNQSVQAIKKMIILSYNHLPSHLKPCFLYLSIFPGNVEIQIRHLIDRWITEGFVTSRVGMDIEAVAMSYFYDLINRGLIQPSRVNVEGRVKSCRVHGVISDIVESISRDKKFVYLTSDIVRRAPEENFRHVAHHGQNCPNISMDWSYVRSFTLFGMLPMEPVCSAYLRMMSVLDLQSAKCSITQKDINNIGLLHRLKYVNVRGHLNICALPASIGKLHGLQYLDVRNTSITSLPTEISKLHSLVSLRCSNEKIHQDGPKEGLMLTLCLPMVSIAFGCSGFRAESGGVMVPRGIGELQELQILEVVDIGRTSSRAIKELGELMQLRKLSTVTAGATMQKCRVFCAAIEKLSSLSSLRVDAGTSSLKWLHYGSSPPHLLRSLKLVGCLGEEISNWLGSLMHLVKIQLEHSGLKDGGRVMQVLGALPKLMLLGLSGMSYVGEELIFRAELFPSLTKLDIYGLPELRGVIFEEDTSPCIERIEISRCCLQSGIIGIKHLPRLRSISLGQGCRVGGLGELQGEVNAHPNHPVLQLLLDRSYHDLVDVAECSNVVQVQEATVQSSHFLEPAAVGESSTQGSHRQGSDIEEVEGSTVVEDDFCSCNSDDEYDDA